MLFVLVEMCWWITLHVIGGLRLGDQASCLHRVLAVVDMTWHSAGRLTDAISQQQWRTEDASFIDPQFVIHVAKAECFLLGPRKTEAAEVLAFLPPTPSDCACLGDLYDVSARLSEPLGVLIAKVAWELGRCSV